MNSGRRKRLIISAAGFSVMLLVILLAVRYYWYIFKPNVSSIDGKNTTYLFIPTGGGFKQVHDSIVKNKLLKNVKSFEWVANRWDYDEKVRPGRYALKKGMSNLEIVRMLAAGRQEPVRVVFNNIRTKEDMAGRIGKQLEADSADLLMLMKDPDFLHEFDVNQYTVFTLFIPNTYEFYWNTTPGEFFRRMKKEQKKFWNDDRLNKCSFAGLTPDQVVTLASIVEKETNKDSEKSIIAGVYMNRLQRGWPLQADPTLIFALNDYTIKRVFAEHKLVDSPYNTYARKGLPPGPICIPSIASIEAVLNYRKHDYMYFCAREDLSGYHVFAETIDQHTRNARRYQSALNRLNIR